jgi:hypothetical protein
MKNGPSGPVLLIFWRGRHTNLVVRTSFQDKSAFLYPQKHPEKFDLTRNQLTTTTLAF